MVFIVGVLFGQKEIVMLLIEGGADFEVKNNDGMIVLYVVVFFCCEKIVKVLFVKGVDWNVWNNVGVIVFDFVVGFFDDVKLIYDFLQVVFGFFGLKLDYEFIKDICFKIVELFCAEQ